MRISDWSSDVCSSDLTGEEGRVAQVGDTVSVHYRGTMDDGSEFDSSAGRDPLEFTVGSGQVIHGLDTAVVGMAVGEKKEVRLERSEERRVGKEGVSKCRCGWST